MLHTEVFRITIQPRGDDFADLNLQICSREMYFSPNRKRLAYLKSRRSHGLENLEKVQSQGLTSLGYAIHVFHRIWWNLLQSKEGIGGRRKLSTLETVRPVSNFKLTTLGRTC